MSPVVREQRGLALPELLMAALLMLVIMGATLTSLTTFESTSRINELQNDNQEAVRAAIDQIAREFRNHGVSTQDAPQGIALMGSYDLVFQTIGLNKPATTANVRNVERIRYCLDTSNPRNERLWSQTQTWTSAAPPAVPSTASCPDAAWGNQRILADKITNRFNPANPSAFKDRPIFIPNSAVTAEITRIDLSLYLDSTPGGGPADAPNEVHIDSGIFLRNQNQAPTASFTAAVTGSRHIVLNASDSNDPDNQSLQYVWKDNGVTIDARGQTADYTPTTRGSHVMTLVVTDPGGLSATTTRTVVVS
jgi:hypothetical protein